MTAAAVSSFAVVVFATRCVPWPDEVSAALADQGFDPQDTVLVRESYAPAEEEALRSRVGTALAVSATDDTWGGVVRWQAPLPTEALIACCFYHRWIDARQRRKIEQALEDGGGILIVVVRSLNGAAKLALRLLGVVDVPVQLHELSPTWTLSKSAFPDQS